jgi:hypothetical protein
MAELIPPEKSVKRNRVPTPSNILRFSQSERRSMNWIIDLSRAPSLRKNDPWNNGISLRQWAQTLSRQISFLMLCLPSSGNATNQHPSFPFFHCNSQEKNHFKTELCTMKFTNKTQFFIYVKFISCLKVSNGDIAQW